MGLAFEQKEFLPSEKQILPSIVPHWHGVG